MSYTTTNPPADRGAATSRSLSMRMTETGSNVVNIELLLLNAILFSIF